MSGAASVAVGSGVGAEVSLVLGEVVVDGESGMNGPIIAPTITMNAMPPHPREVFFEATCSAYAVGVTIFGKQGVEIDFNAYRFSSGLAPIFER